MIQLASDQEWLHKAAKELSKYWRRKNARRHGLITENQADGLVG